MEFESNSNSQAALNGATDSQLELGLGAARCRVVNQRNSRNSRARWWFERMRQVVDRAADYLPAPPPPEQMVFGPRTQPQPNPDERQLCE